MAIRIIDGVPGSGKSYYAVNHLVETYVKQKKEIEIITNIDSLLLDHVSLDDLLLSTPLETIFSVDWCKARIEANQGKPIIFLIDEAQRFFHKKYYDVKVFFLFQYHRHLGMDIYLITQNEKLLPMQLTTLSEYVIHSQPRSTSIIGEFKYLVKISGENVDRKILKPKQEIFDLYCSMTQKEVEKVSNPFKKYLVLMVVALVVAGYFLKTQIFNFSVTGKANAAPIPTSSPSGSPPASSSSSPAGIAANPSARTPEPEKLLPLETSYLIDQNKRMHVYDPTVHSLLPVEMVTKKLSIYRTQKLLKVFIHLTEKEMSEYKTSKEKEENGQKQGNSIRATTNN